MTTYVTMNITSKTESVLNQLFELTRSKNKSWTIPAKLATGTDFTTTVTAVSKTTFKNKISDDTSVDGVTFMKANHIEDVGKKKNFWKVIDLNIEVRSAYGSCMGKMEARFFKQCFSTTDLFMGELLVLDYDRYCDLEVEYEDEENEVYLKNLCCFVLAACKKAETENKIATDNLFSALSKVKV